jgi:alpha-tubulin suppressor-like RCC1 family protein
MGHSTTPVTVTGISTATAVAAGGNHICTLLSDGTVKCWGHNDKGQLGDGTTTDAYTPVPVTGIATATAITAGNDHTCALLADNRVMCWGSNMPGKLGNGTAGGYSSIPVDVVGL